jgi:predicted acylesterase/phospholipase RssA
MSTAVVLSGGAALAAFEVGVLNALARGLSPATGFRPLTPDIITGTSAGAFNASLCLSFAHRGFGYAASAAEWIWLNHVAEGPGSCGGIVRLRANPSYLTSPSCDGRNPSEGLRLFAGDSVFLARQAVDRTVAFLHSSGTAEKRALDVLDISVLVSTDGFRELVAATLNLEAIRRSPIQLRIAATNWRSGTVSVFGNADMVDGRGYDIVLGSAAVPGIFPPVTIDRELYADGGLSLNTPLGPAIDAGADTIHVVYVNPAVDSIPIVTTGSTLADCYRILAITLAVGFDHEIKRAQRINAGLEVLRGAHTAPGPERDKGVVETAGALRRQPLKTVPYRHLTIHRHFYKGKSSAFDWLTFRRDRIEAMMNDGVAAAIDHDCKANQCVGIRRAEPIL